ncbi:hypothetical protein LPJ72_003899, partial [Coemansia sp. Benny D160-2]
EYERKWLLRLRTDGLQDMYETNMKLRAEMPLQYSRMNGSATTNQFEKNVMGGEADEGNYFDMHAYSNKDRKDEADKALKLNSGVYMADDDMHTSPQVGRNDMAADESGNRRRPHFDRRSLNSLDMMEAPEKVRHIL